MTIFYIDQRSENKDQKVLTFSLKIEFYLSSGKFILR